MTRDETRTNASGDAHPRSGARGTWRVGVCALFTLAACADEPPPPVCRAMLDCLDAQADALGHELSSTDRQALRDAFDEGGECWRDGLDDDYAMLCVESCEAFHRDDCAREAQARCADAREASSLSCEALGA